MKDEGRMQESSAGLGQDRRGGVVVEISPKSEVRGSKSEVGERGGVGPELGGVAWSHGTCLRALEG